jgi:hypothetical protein
MNRISKHKIPLWGTFSLVLPEEAQILSVTEENNEAVIWTLYNIDDENILTREFRIVSEGENIREEDLDVMLFVYTFHLQNRNFIGHLFEVRK